MAQIDHSIYFQQQAPDLAGSYSKGLSMKQMALDGERKQKQSDQAEQMRQVEMIARLGPNIKDQASWDAARAELQQAGVDMSKEPVAFDEGYIGRRVGLAMSVTDQKGLEEKRLDNDRQNKLLGLKEREVRAAEKAAGVKAQLAANSGDNLPLDQKKTVEALSTKNANKISIRNQIDAVMSGWDKLSEDQKVATGRSLLKTLNSTEGADAIGVEEANRLGAKLEFALGNFTNSNPTQFGRDLKGFKEQAINTSKGIGDAVMANQDQIDGIMGRRKNMRFDGPKQKVAGSKPLKTSEIEWAD
jgi:hypothetical protein